MSPRPRKKFSESPRDEKRIEFAIEDCPINLSQYMRKDGTLDIDSIPEPNYIAFSDWAKEKSAQFFAPSRDVYRIAVECDLPPDIVEYAFSMSQYASTPIFDADKDSYTIQTDLGHIGALREKGGKLPLLIELLESSAISIRRAQTLIEAGFLFQFSGRAKPRISRADNVEIPDDPNPLLGRLLQAVDRDCRLHSLMEEFYETADKMREVLTGIAEIADDAQEGVEARAGNTREPDWMVWVANRLKDRRFTQKKFLALMQAMKVGDSGKAAWKRAKIQSVRDKKAGGASGSPMPPDPSEQ